MFAVGRSAPVAGSPVVQLDCENHAVAAARHVAARSTAGVEQPDGVAQAQERLADGGALGAFGHAVAASIAAAALAGISIRAVGPATANLATLRVVVVIVSVRDAVTVAIPSGVVEPVIAVRDAVSVTIPAACLPIVALALWLVGPRWLDVDRNWSHIDRDGLKVDRGGSDVSR